MSSLCWLTSHQCSSSISQSSSETSVSAAAAIFRWLRFIFLSPCPQRIIFSSIDALFLTTLLVLFSLQKLCSSSFIIPKTNNIPNSSSITTPLLEIRSKSPTRSILSLVLPTAMLAISCAVLCILALVQGTQSPWQLVFWLVHAITHLGILLLLFGPRHPVVVSLQLYWVANFILVSLLAASGITRFVSFGGNYDPSMKRDDVVVSFVLVPISVFLFVVSVWGSSEGSDESSSAALDAANVTTGYASCSLLSKATFRWLSPLLSKGYKSPLEMEQVPSLSPHHQAGKMADIFEMNWPKPEENPKNPLRTTLIRCFWKDLVFTGCLAVTQLLCLYVGPVLINRFVDFFAAAGSKGRSNNPYEGHYLVLILLCAQVVEVVSSHQFKFHSENLSMLMRSSVISCIYKKGLKLSHSSQTAHDVGRIMNYMGVDTRQVSDLVRSIHSFWLMPCQAIVALLLLYVYIGVSAFAALAIACAALIFSVMCTFKNNEFQHKLKGEIDSRLKATNEMLSNMRVIKFQAWEEYFHQKIQSFRDKEYVWLSKFTYSFSLIFSVMSTFLILQAAAVFGVAILVGTKLDPGRVFTVTTVLKILEDLLRNFPQDLVSATQALISLGRLESFLISNELDLQNEGCDFSTLLAVEVKDGSFSWDDEGDNVILKGLNLEIRKGELAAIVGTVGSGKSSLLAAVLGELQKKSGKVRVSGTTAYVAQTSWIQNATIRENILFGSPMNWDKYNQAIRVCCMEKDLEMMEHGDQTEIGERGINLSGGQKQRIQLARAVYQDCDIYLLDDIFSAVDAHTGSDIFKDCVRGALKDKTILLVTHQLDFLHNANQILVMRDGMIVQSGRYQDLVLSPGSDFGALVAAYETSMELVVMRSSTISNHNSKALTQAKHNSKALTEAKSVERSESEKGTAKLIEEEEREIGNVSLEVYKQYCTEAYGWWGVGAVLLLSFFWQASVMGGDYWLAYETAETTIFNPSLFMTVYSIISGVTCVLIFTRYFTVAYFGLVTARKLFNQIIRSTLRAPMSFFDTTPLGRILTRALSDQASVDLSIPTLSSVTIMVFLSLLGILAVTCINAWPTVFLVVPLFFVNLWYKGYYIASSRELTRLGSITRSPVIGHFSETFSGVMTIRGFRKQKMFFKENVEKVNANLRMDFHQNAAKEWLGFRLELIGVLFLCTVTLFMVTMPGIIRAEYVGMTLSYGLVLNTMLFYTVNLSCDVENLMIAVERIKQFIRTPSEAPWTIPGCLPSPNWPTHGQIVIHDLQVRYRSNTPLVLRGVSVHIRGGEKVGVVGRTGSGKSTLIQVFFRLVEPCGGRIEIDGVDICKLGLHDLRSKFSIIPQDPVLFEGTVRSNVDPLGLYSDYDIWKSLERCQLKDVVAAIPEKLDASVSHNGENWSVGQRQLLCLGRVLLKRSKILFMDEATASVDPQTDGIIQKIIREDFSTCTIISIAHRIPTVMDCDNVLVMDDGRVKEFDAPSRLLERHSLFGALVQEYSNRSEI